MPRIQKGLLKSHDRLVADNPGASVCPLCNGEGAITLDLPLGHPAWGRAFTCPCQYAELAERKMIALFANKNIPDSHRAFTFESFKALSAERLKGKTEALSHAWNLSRDGYIDSTSQDGNGTVRKYGVVLSGEVGRGKSAISVAATLALIADGQSPLWMDYNEFLGDCKQTYKDGYEGPSRDVLVEMAASKRILVLDDMGDIRRATKRATDDEGEIAYGLIRRRWQNYASLGITIITTNLSRDPFWDYFGDRTARRVMERYLWLDVTGEDLSTY